MLKSSKFILLTLGLSASQVFALSKHTIYWPASAASQSYQKFAGEVSIFINSPTAIAGLSERHRNFSCKSPQPRPECNLESLRSLLDHEVQAESSLTTETRHRRGGGYRYADLIDGEFESLFETAVLKFSNGLVLTSTIQK